jgi:hypothetical protein
MVGEIKSQRIKNHSPSLPQVLILFKSASRPGNEK